MKLSALLVLLFVACRSPLPAPPTLAPVVQPTAVPTPSVVVSTAPCHYRTATDGQVLADLTCTPGEADPSITAANVQSTICVAGWLDANRPRPAPSVTDRLKYQGLADYGRATSLTDARAIASAYEEDHLLAREIGGLSGVHLGPNGRPTNLWPAPGASPNKKDTVEGAAHRAICDGQLDLQEAQRMMADDWTALGVKLGVPGL